ncbi:MAG TPA: glycosyltransferase [Mucilaginibacter sp.]|nr:glycosyltransferase [Mucilaginibacter sp.]
MIAILSTISLLLTALYAFVLAYLIKGWHSLKPAMKHDGPYTIKVTVMVAARNEEENIGYTIEDILAQDYPKELTEIIIADDHSTDRTAEIIRSYSGRGVKLLQMNEEQPLNSYKKKAIARAISLSGGELMVATDADCRMGPKWLSSIVSCFQAGDIVMLSAPVAFYQERNLFECLQTLEFSFLIGTGAGFIGNKRASTCNGANLAYLKSTFYEVGGFTGIDKLASGDDELLLQKVAKSFPGKIAFLKNRDAIVFTHAKHTIGSFMKQRRRWASKSTHYKDKRIVALVTGLWLFNLSVFVNAALSFYDIRFFKLFLIQFGIKLLLEAVFLYPVTTFLKRPSLLPLLIILSPLHIIYFIYIGMLGSTRKYEWKGRMVR